MAAWGPVEAYGFNQFTHIPEFISTHRVRNQGVGVYCEGDCEAAGRPGVPRSSGCGLWRHEPSTSENPKKWKEKRTEKRAG